MAKGNIKVPDLPTFEVEEAIETPVVNVQLNHDRQVRTLEQTRTGLVQEYMREKKVPVTLAPMYAAFFGRVLQTSINGITIAVPCDGGTYEVPESFAAEINGKRRMTDVILMKQDRLADTANNKEQAPGELELY